ncbi:hypothetical protein NC652_007755 [Populus alba x Populus x berolinensis]|uniref:Uncharacterized protein n=1 Tax=Populus alba x Populus x berolinensis TaxID=444605 RepID=A0AAD6QJW9_9ROSI|nr:hypothetical protein NC652_007755 [Populus alba x Populus x berolinensis]KAJ6991709.1 hypothetical protein NC653_019775 [Populus alba x Populus x berolinensis]
MSSILEARFLDGSCILLFFSRRCQDGIISRKHVDITGLSKYITMLSSDSVGCRVYSLSCYISDDIHSLFSLLSLPPPPPPPPHLIKTNSTSTETKDSTSNDGNTLALILYEILHQLALLIIFDVVMSQQYIKVYVMDVHQSLLRE